MACSGVKASGQPHGGSGLSTGDREMRKTKPAPSGDLGGRAGGRNTYPDSHASPGAGSSPPLAQVAGSSWSRQSTCANCSSTGVLAPSSGLRWREGPKGVSAGGRCRQCEGEGWEEGGGQGRGHPQGSAPSQHWGLDAGVTWRLAPQFGASAPRWVDKPVLRWAPWEKQACKKGPNPVRAL